MADSGELTIRSARAPDWDKVMEVIVGWWGGRDLRALLPRLFFQHFTDSSFVVESDGRLIAFLVGFACPTHPDEAYIHFVGVDPDLRGRGIGRMLYERFFAFAAESGRDVVRLVTSPVNKGSIAFHRRMGFAVLPGDGEIDGVSVWRDYDGPGEHRVRFQARLD
jgi:ribosomal protein S18 acetylase RimI-like enzyme